MTRQELESLLKRAVRDGAITREDAARLLAAFDAGTLDVDDLPRDEGSGALVVGTVVVALLLSRLRRAPARWQYDPGTRRLIAPKGVRIQLRHAPEITGGSVISPAQARAVADRILDAAEAPMAQLGERLLERRIGLAPWFTQMEEMIAERHIAMAAMAAGGFEQLSGADKEFIRERIERQFAFLDGFADDIRRGRQPMDGRYRQRVLAYDQAARGTYEAMRQRVAEAQGEIEVLNALAPADHCAGCVRQTRLGWHDPNGPEHVAIGDRDCLYRDRCVHRFRMRQTRREVA